MAIRVLNATSMARDLGRWRTEAEDASGRKRTSRPTYRALADGIRLLIHDGRIPLGVGLPSERDLSSALDLSRTTITSSYAVLREEGYLISKQGARSTVALPDMAKPNGLLVQSRSTGPVIDMSHAAMAAPTDAMLHAYNSALQALPAYLSNHGMEPIGLAVLRESIARRFVERGLPTTPDQIMVTSGAQQAVRLLLGTLTSPGDRVLIDHPTYPNALEAIRRVGARPVPVPIRPDGEPWDLDGIRSAARQTASKVAYMIPDFHNPTGRCLPADGRAELAKIARDTSMTLIVDETMVDLWLDAPPPPPVASFGRVSGTDVVTIGSASKSYWGGLRIGWIRANPSLISRLAGSRAAHDLGTSVMDQLAAGFLLQDADAILDTRREQLRERRGVLESALADHLPGWTYRRSTGGMSLWLQIPTPVSSALAATAPTFGAVLAAGPRFGVEGAFERFLRLPYTREPAEITAAVVATAGAYAALAPSADDREPALVF
ncbi:MocR-like transcription factor YczR [Rhodococcoides fascians]|uniref:MocR-like transcription factor YczR n=1 Tax=Rhodococcoides fascians TaxID=1828 RepID=UPI00055B457D|nr:MULTISPECIES: PLP-dependent aminotransferase family protein [Rhodococcus]OZC91254.1 PLP-dependent aminotransferase family protein [Rhodococcus sp. 06-418-1B]